MAMVRIVARRLITPPYRGHNIVHARAASAAIRRWIARRGCLFGVVEFY
jgi:hypothetical protein